MRSLMRFSFELESFFIFNIFSSALSSSFKKMSSLLSEYFFWTFTTKLLYTFSISGLDSVYEKAGYYSYCE